MTLDEIDITNLVWINQFQYSPIAQTADRSLTGGMIIQEGEKKYGQSIILSESWLTKSVIEALKVKEAIGNLTMLLTLDDGTEHSVVFDRTTTAGVYAKPVFNHTNPDDNWQYTATIRLLTVEPETEITE